MTYMGEQPPPGFIDRSSYKALSKPHYLLGVYYDGKLGRAVLEFLSEEGDRVVKVVDPTGHKPYFLTDLSLDEAKSIKELSGDKDVDRLEEVVKVNPLTMERVRVTKIVTKDPLAVKKLRDKVPKGASVWEAKIKYHSNYIYDNQLIPGMRYVIENDGQQPRITLVKPEIPLSLVQSVRELFRKEPPETVKLAEDYLILFEEAPPRAVRVAMDIEVYTPFKGRIPNPRQGEYPVISIAFSSNNGFRKVLLLGRPFKQRFDYMIEEYPVDVEVEVFDSEKAMLLEALKTVSKYPVLLTYNGDNFDLVYIYTRAVRLGVPRYLVPLSIGEDMVRLETGVHLDLYKFFSNRAVKNYAFSGKYQEEKLDAVSSALLGVSKIGFEETIGDISASLLVAYNMRDADITLQLTTFSNELVWRLMILLARISKTSIEDVCRRQISSWIQNQFFWEHRRLEYLIPNSEDIVKYAGRAGTRAIIDGKKYAGALVIEPPKGVFFNVMVLDIASLYPSIIKKYNLSYETVDMPWCKSTIDITDETGRKLHRVCTDKPGLTAQITGILRDFRVGIYKKRAKDKSLPKDTLAWYDVVQRAIKVFINASYGVFGDSRFSLFSPAVAESVTAMGRKSFMTIVLKAAELGVKPLYGDTDSIFVWNPNRGQLEVLQKWILENLGLEIELDKEFTYVVFTGLKKNYLGRTGDGGIEIKGLVAKKRNTPEFLKELFQEILGKLKDVETPEDFVSFANWLEDRLKEYYVGLKRREVPLDRLAIRVALTKPPSSYTKTKPPHVRAAMQLANYGISVQEGDVITYVKVKGREGYKAIQLTRLHEVDPDKYVELIKSGLEQLLAALSIRWEDIVGGVGLTGYATGAARYR
ncbi:DNA-directed DNA polymerase I [Desulfurococcus mucosus]|uniref:DNA polymerase n=1 Tax=Desulfurococcus mucosus (strain ATCC 35584 / DSM 2162 / JCM 9187 / O7/1) TaxID=765177 RepID=E8R7D4_DESM0|nr:replicative DNA polymerase I [Desulfurococcus mucosus DSM 2162]